MDVKKKPLQKTKAEWAPHWENRSQNGSPPKLFRKEHKVKYPFRCGDKVMCLLEIDRLRKMQEGYGCWDSKMATFIGKTGSVCGITGQGGVRVRFGRNTRWTFHPGALTKLHTFWVGDVVRVIDDVETVKKSQTSHGNWKEEMTHTVGQIGKVVKVHEDGDLRVQFQDKSWIFNPACLTFYRRKKDENFITPSSTTEAKCQPTESLREEGVRRCLFQPEDDFLDIKIVQKIPDKFEDLDHFQMICNIETPIKFPDDLGELSAEMTPERTPNVASADVWLADSPEPLKEALVEKTTSLVPETESRITVCKRFLKDFEDIKEIDSGGFGTVFKARHRLDKKVYAIKRVGLTDDGGEGEREVQALVKLEHKYIVRYHTCWIGKDTYESEDSSCDSSSGEDCLYDCRFIQMEFCEKGTLEFWIDKKNETEIHEDNYFFKFKQIVKGVAYIHSQDIIHRDLKPSNIFITSQDKIKIGDFGLAAFGVDDLSTKRTKSKGTRTYMAPEQMGTKYGKEVDIFPLGLIWFEMLYRFGTEFERSKKWEDIRGCQLPSEFEKQFPAEAPTIKKLLSKEPFERLCVRVLLDLLNRDFNHQESLAKSLKNQSEAWIG